MDHTSILLLLVVALNCLLTATRVAKSMLMMTPGSPGPASELKFSYIDQDYPTEAPISPLPPVAMSFQESVRFSTTGSEEDRNVDWAAYDGNAPEKWVFGHVWLGSARTPFVPIMNHQLHCLQYVGESLANYDDTVSSEHVAHCLNYMRQTLLCSADSHLEPGDFMHRDFEADRVDDVRVCKDWSTVFSWIESENSKYLPF